MEVERTVPVSGEAKVPSQAELAAVKGRFAEYTKWMMTSPNGMEERDGRGGKWSGRGQKRISAERDDS